MDEKCMALCDALLCDALISNHLESRAFNTRLAVAWSRADNEAKVAYIHHHHNQRQKREIRTWLPNPASVTL